MDEVDNVLTFLCKKKKRIHIPIGLFIQVNAEATKASQLIKFIGDRMR